MDSRHFSTSVQDMPPPVLDSPPQVLEIDPSSSTSLHSPSTSVTWDSPPFAVHGFADPSTYGPHSSSRQVQIEHSRGKARNPILNWYIDNDGPWVPKSSISELSNERQPRIPQDTRLSFQHGDPYNHRIPSDAGSYQYGVPASDSGYGTRRSDGDASVFSADGLDKDPDNQSFGSRVIDLQHYTPTEDGFQQHGSHLSDLSLLPEVINPNNSPGKFICQKCQKCVKTRSELKKHDLRHTKPFICEYTGCNRTEGFSTSNDLERHVKSKHPMVIISSEPTKRYRCHVPGCKSKDKSWPRLDNFRSHLKRVHEKYFKREDEFEMLVQRAAYWEPPASSVNLDQGFCPEQTLLETSRAGSPTVSTGPGRLPITWTEQYSVLEAGPNYALSSLTEGPEHPDEDILLHGLPMKYNSLPEDTIQPLDTLQTREELDSHKQPSYHDVLAPLNLRQILSDVSGDTLNPGAESRGPHAPDKAEGRSVATVDAITQAIKAALIGDTVPEHNGDPAMHHSPQWTLSRPNSSLGRPCQLAPGATESLTKADIKPGASPSPSSSSIGAEALRKASDNFIDTLHRLGYTVQKDPIHSAPKLNTGSVASNKSDNVLTCQKCRKFKGRPCELKKHMKRHSRPYGCTYPACNNKTFGSKNDWKRHENSQHFHHESWRCDEQKADGGVCAKVCYRLQTFTEHLQNDHSISDSTDLNLKTQSCHIGRNSQARFWCGFCVRLIELKKKSTDAWAERFDHIDDHFMGRNGQKAQSIREWVPVDSSDKAERRGSPPLDCHSTSSHGDGEDSPGSTSSRSANESSPEPADIAGSSSETDLRSTQEGLKRKRPVEDSKEGPEKQRRKPSSEASYI